jgi:CRP-like cAMP-binding protein
MSYDAAVALDFFKSAGKPTEVRKGTTIFAEKEKAKKLLLQREKLYLLLDGEVSLIAGRKVIGTANKGEIFGEMAALTHAPRSATAVARSDCRLIALDEAEFKAGLEKKPAFALMLMSLMIARLRETIARLAVAGKVTVDSEEKDAAAFDPRRLGELVSGLADDPPVYYQQGKNIMTEGQKALRMYAVVSGSVAVSIRGRVVERLGPGGAFGEAALIDQSTRLATVTAQTDCEVQPITRQAFLQLMSVNAEFGYGVLSSLANRLRVLTERL